MNTLIDDIRKKLDWLEINPEAIHYQMQEIRLLLNKLEKEIEEK